MNAHWITLPREPQGWNQNKKEDDDDQAPSSKGGKGKGKGKEKTSNKTKGGKGKTKNKGKGKKGSEMLTGMGIAADEYDSWGSGKSPGKGEHWSNGKW